MPTELLDLIGRTVVVEAKRPKEPVVLSSGQQVDYGSPEHVADIESSLQHLVRLRDAQGRGSSKRYVYARAIDQRRRDLLAVQRGGDETVFRERSRKEQPRKK